MKILKFLAGVVGLAAGPLLGSLPHSAQIGVQVVSSVLTVLGIRDAATDPSVAFKRFLDGLGGSWKTIVGALVFVVGAFLSPDVLAQLPPATAKILETVGAVLAALGLYHKTAAAGVQAKIAAAVSPRLASSVAGR